MTPPGAAASASRSVPFLMRDERGWLRITLLHGLMAARFDAGQHQPAPAPPKSASSSGPTHYCASIMDKKEDYVTIADKWAFQDGTTRGWWTCRMRSFSLARTQPLTGKHVVWRHRESCAKSTAVFIPAT